MLARTAAFYTSYAMPHALKLTLPLAALLLAAGAPARAQIANVPDSLRRAGELVGSRPSARRPAGARARPVAAAAPTAADPARARAADLPGLYERFIETCQAQRRTWSENDWDAAANALARLNQRYDQVRTALPLQDRLNIRSAQAEFHTLQGARKVKDRLDN